MPFVPLPLLEAAASGLLAKHPLAVVVLPSMVHAGVGVVASASEGAEYGSGDEVAVLNAYFTIPGGPPGTPYRAIWEEKPQSYWRDKQYAGRSFQRMRKDRVQDGSAFFQEKTARGSKDRWGLRATCGQGLRDAVVESDVRLVDLALWYGRSREVEDLDSLIEWFLDEFPLEQADLIGSIYTDSIPGHYREIPFAPEPITQTEYAESIGGSPEPVRVEGTLAELAERIEAAVTAGGFVMSEGLVGRVISAWASGDIVVLVGQPGTGKTFFATLVQDALTAELSELATVWVAITPDSDESDMLGYERLDGSVHLGPLADRVLRSDQPLGPHLVVLEEFNLAALETYMPSILVASQDPQRRVAIPGGETAHLPVDTFILATCNSYLDEPETRLRLSHPSKRRTTVISMPNVLADRFDSDGDEVLVELLIQMVEQEKGRVQDRVGFSLGSAFDSARLAHLTSVSSADQLSEDVRSAWIAIGKKLLSTSHGRAIFTLGIVRDIGLSIAYAKRNRDDELLALGRAVADKLIHQLRGPKSVADDFLTVCADLPNTSEISALVDRMKSGPGDDLLPLI